MKQPGLTVVHAAALRDAAGLNARPGSLVVKDGRVLAAGVPASLPPELVCLAEVIDRRESLLLPGFVNAHTHLELTDVGPQPYNPAGGFLGWVKFLRASCPSHLAGRGESAGRGAMLSKQSGVQAVGNIVPEAFFEAARMDQGLEGVSYLELFGLGPPFDADAMQRIETAIVGLQPHAPYSAGPAIYEAAARSGKPVSTHLAETKDEVAFVSSCSGPHVDYLKQIGKWDDGFASHYGRGLSPVRWMQPYLNAAAADGGWLVAHGNYTDDDDIAILGDTNTHVAYCPIASEYFGHQNHRYRDMLDAGINVCLGTDSIVCALPDDPQPLGLMSAMRRLYHRDQTNPETLLAMATINGAKALRFDRAFATLGSNAPAEFACIKIDTDSPVDPLKQVLTSQQPVEALSFKVPQSA
ncbi:MAG: amidohydrolase family protein [Phycisphaeraceae bacterium]